MEPGAQLMLSSWPQP